MTDPLGSKITSIDDDACVALLASVFTASPSLNETAARFEWLLAHCDSGVIWGRRDASGGWHLSSDLFEISPKIASGDWRSVQQLRLFSNEGELLIWRVDRSKPTFAGRVIEDAVADPDDKPLDRRMLLLGDRVLETKNGFSLIGDATGACHAIPIDCGETLRERPVLRVRHYFERDAESGALRIAVTRLCGLT